MEIVIIGSGNVAYCFSHLLQLRGHPIRQVISRDKDHAKQLAENLNATYSNELADIDMNADIYLLAVRDEAIRELDATLRLGKRIVAHTGGSVPMQAIRHISGNIGVIYPLQSIRKEIKEVENIPVILEAGNEMVLKRLQALAEAISDQIVVMDSRQRLKMHLAAVLCNNFTNHLLALCKDYCGREGLDFDLLRPLLHETFDRLEKFDPAEVQTGPAIRNDGNTIEQHRQLLDGYPQQLKIYELMTESIRKFAGNHLA